MNMKKIATVAAVFIDLAALAHIILWYNTPPEAIKGLIDTIPLWASITTFSFLLAILGYLGYNKLKLDHILFLIVEKGHSLIDEDDKTIKWIFKSFKNDEHKLRSILISSGTLYPVHHAVQQLDAVQQKDKAEKLKIIFDSIKDKDDLLEDVLLAPISSTAWRNTTPLYETINYGNEDAFKIIFDSIKNKPQLLEDVLLTGAGTSSTPLHLANADVFKIIFDSIKDKADLLKNVLLAENGSGKTALERAMDRGDIELIRVMASKEVINCLRPEEDLNENQIKCKKLLKLAKQIFEYNNDKSKRESFIQLINNDENLNLIKDNTAMLKLVMMNLDALDDENDIVNILSKLIKDNTSKLKPVLLYLATLDDTKADTIGKILKLIKMIIKH